jgi:(p)ppGpp synthase/HD superfamily hydrolase
MPADLEHAISLAVEAHRGQKDRAGAPYILHPLRMMFRVETDAEKIVAVLHDVVEDTGWTLDRLRAEGFPEDVVAAVDHLTRREGESYDEFVRRAAAHPVARRVKIADLEDNMDVRRTGTVTDEDTERLTRYHRAWRSLVDDLAGG